MRRADREVTDTKAIEKFIAEEQILRIAFYDDGDIYIVPVNYGFVCEDTQYTFYFHGASAGRKYELSKSNPIVGFEIDGKYQIREAEAACGFTAAFQSVTGTGTLRIVEDPEEKKLGLNALMKQIAQCSHWNYSEKMLEAVTVFKLHVHKMSCKAK